MYTRKIHVQARVKATGKLAAWIIKRGLRDGVVLLLEGEKHCITRIGILGTMVSTRVSCNLYQKRHAHLQQTMGYIQ